MSRFLTFFCAVLYLSGCSLVTIPVKVATKTVGAAVSVTATAVDVVTPDLSSDDDEKKDRDKKSE